jgi:EsV-1-7 cysteine-rich motif
VLTARMRVVANVPILATWENLLCTVKLVYLEELIGKLFNVKSIRCEHEGCTKQPSFGFAKDGVSAAAATAGYTNAMLYTLTSITAEISCILNCNAVLYEQVRRRCRAHILRGMEYVVFPPCEVCNKRVRGPGFKHKGDKNARWCEQCKPSDAVRGLPQRETAANA